VSTATAETQPLRVSFHNTVLIASQARPLGFEPTYVAGFRTWLKLNRCVAKGATALRILAPVGGDEGSSNRQAKLIRVDPALQPNARVAEPVPTL
jgi:hypothetical protein